MRVHAIGRIAAALTLVVVMTCSRHSSDAPADWLGAGPDESLPAPALDPPVLEVVMLEEEAFVLSEPDAGSIVVEPIDAGPEDAGPPDDGPEDAGLPDAGVVDAGAPLAGCLKILPLGDSITIGSNGGYRNSLHTQLTALGCGVDLVGSMNDQTTHIADKDHEGHAGYTINGIADQVPGWLASANPNLVLLLIGTNDIAWFTNDTAAEIADRHAQLVDQILAAQPGAWVIVGSIPPITPAIIPAKGFNRAVLAQQLNVEIASRVHARERLGKKVRFADIAAALTLADLYDGVHPTLAASSKITHSWLQVLTPLTSCSSHPPCTP